MKKNDYVIAQDSPTRLQNKPKVNQSQMLGFTRAMTIKRNQLNKSTTNNKYNDDNSIRRNMSPHSEISIEDGK